MRCIQSAMENKIEKRTCTRRDNDPQLNCVKLNLAPILIISFASREVGWVLLRHGASNPLLPYMVNC